MAEGKDLRACETLVVREDGSVWARHYWTGEERLLFKPIARKEEA